MVQLARRRPGPCLQCHGSVRELELDFMPPFFSADLANLIQICHPAGALGIMDIERRKQLLPLAQI